jgi:hypothetical protein
MVASYLCTRLHIVLTVPIQLNRLWKFILSTSEPNITVLARINSFQIKEL